MRPASCARSTIRPRPTPSAAGPARWPTRIQLRGLSRAHAPRLRRALRERRGPGGAGRRVKPAHYSVEHYADADVAEGFDAAALRRPDRRAGRRRGGARDHGVRRRRVRRRRPRRRHRHGPRGAGHRCRAAAASPASTTRARCCASARRGSPGPRSPVGLLRGDARHLPFADRRFDVTVSVRLLMHMPDWRAHAHRAVPRDAAPPGHRLSGADERGRGPVGRPPRAARRRPIDRAVSRLRRRRHRRGLPRRRLPHPRSPPSLRPADRAAQDRGGAPASPAPAKARCAPSASPRWWARR